MAYPFPLSHENTPRAAAARVRATKKPGAISRPGGWRTFGEYAFLEDSRYTSQEDYEGNLSGGVSGVSNGGGRAGEGRVRLYLNASRPSPPGRGAREP